eukprot:GHVR01040167.1.p1 GENE.GHVR01040167.1~~GHVR01040167.1.p1  ORF type:complete len:104 (-),score=2.32 GHVR01040167.1:1174-1485(-)
MASAFTIPPIIGSYIAKKYDMNKNTSFKMSQIMVPLMVQIVATPIHLLGLDIYNREGRNVRDRFTYIKSIYVNSLLLRMMRFLPAYGLGGIVNIEIRNHFKHN